MIRFFFTILIAAGFLFGGNGNVRAEDNTILLAADPWPPYYGPEMENEGLVAEIARQALKRVGYTCKIQFVPWKRALNYAMRGECHGLLGAFYKERRTKYFMYSDSVYKTRMVFFAGRETKISYQGLKDLAGYKIGVIRGYEYSDEFDSAEYFQKEEVTVLEQNIKKTLMGRIDAFIGSREVVLHALDTLFPEYKESLKIIGEHKVNKLYIPISKTINTHEEIVRDLNQGLNSIKSDGTFDRIIQTCGF